MQSNEISTGVLLHPAGQEATSCLDKKRFKERARGRARRPRFDFQLCWTGSRLKGRDGISI